MEETKAVQSDRASPSEVMETFLEKCIALATTLKKKNDDYENSIFKTGIFGILARLFDKMQRIQTIITTGQVSVTNESLEDTFEDLAGYAILGRLALEQNPTFYRSDGTVRGTDNDDWKNSKWAKEIVFIVNSKKCKDCFFNFNIEYEDCPRCKLINQLESQEKEPIVSSVDLDAYLELEDLMERH